jgi:glycosyltransferase involved in cell wall biosynthesis
MGCVGSLYRSCNGKMRITFLLTQDLESPSGLGRYWPLGRELAKVGHKVNILALHSNYSALKLREKDFVRGGVHIRYIGQMHVRKVRNRKLYFKPLRLIYVVLVGTLRLTWAALCAPADVYHVGKPHPMNGLAGLVASKLRRKPLYLDCDDYEVASNRFETMWQRLGIGFFEHHLPRCATGISVNTRFTLKRLIKSGYPSDHIRYVPNGVDRHRFCSTSRLKAEELRRQLGLADREIIVYVGSLSLTSHGGLELLLEAFTIVQQTCPRAALLFVGGGEDYDELRGKVEAMGIKDAVWFTGRVSPEHVALYYLLADVSVDPVYDKHAQRARSPLKIVESLAVGTPVVTGDVGDRSMYIKDSQAGRLVCAGDAAALASGIVGVLEEEDGSQEAVGLLADEYFWDSLVHDFAQIYELKPEKI